jgi:hypothetical protein
MSRFDWQLSRREWLRLSAAGVLGCSLSGWLERLAAAADGSPRKRSCILLWMNGGPSQMDTFDLKPGHANGGPFKEIATSVPGMKFSEHLPKLAKKAKHLALVRSMSTKEGDHQQATYYMRTGYRARGPVQYPPLGSTLSKELGNPDASLPNYVSIAPVTFISPAAFTPGFMGPEYAPLIVGNQGFGFGQQQPDYDRLLTVEDLQAPGEVKREQVDSRIELLQGLQRDFVAKHPGVPALSHQSAYERAVRLMRTAAGKAFELKDEDKKLRDRYGRNLFGQGCLLARRLIERGVPFVEVTLSSAQGAPNNWDTHQQNFEQVKKLCEVLDPAWATLLEDLEQRGLLETTMVVWMGEFGRTPKINPQQGRDHFPDAWSTVLCGGGIQGGAVYGKTSPDGMTVKDNPVTVPNFLATVATAVGVDPTKQNMSNVGRPIRIADAGSKPIKEVLS